MISKEDVCAIVVTYNRKKLLKECLEGLLAQTKPLTAIYIVDNASTDGTPEYLFKQGYIEELPPENLSQPWERNITIKNNTGELIKLHYIRLPQNTGGAGGFYEGLKRAYNNRHDWYWLMDDDVKPIKEGLEKLLKYKHFSKCIHPSREYKDGQRIPWNGYISERIAYFVKLPENFKDLGFTCVNYGCFEGMLIHKDVIKQIGFPDPRFFLVGDDTYYGYKASKVTNVLYIKEICLIKLIDKSNQKISKFKLYLKHRNYAYFFPRIAQEKFITALLRLGVALKDSIKYRTIVPLKGFIHGIFNIWGKEKDFLN